jgi:hypothetical protein
VLCVIETFVTTPAIEIFGEAFIFIEKVAVRVTWPVVIILSESLEVMVRVAGEFDPAATFPLRHWPAEIVCPP